MFRVYGERATKPKQTCVSTRDEDRSRAALAMESPLHAVQGDRCAMMVRTRSDGLACCSLGYGEAATTERSA